MMLNTSIQPDSFKIDHIHNISVINVKGELSRHNILTFEKLLSSLSACQHLNIVLDCEELVHFDYQLVRRFIDHVISFQCEGGDIRMANVKPYVQQILKVMGFEEDFYFSKEEALLSFLEGCPYGELQ